MALPRWALLLVPRCFASSRAKVSRWWKLQPNKSGSMRSRVQTWELTFEGQHNHECDQSYLQQCRSRIHLPRREKYQQGFQSTRRSWFNLGLYRFIRWPCGGNSFYLHVQMRWSWNKLGMQVSASLDAVVVMAVVFLRVVAHYLNLWICCHFATSGLAPEIPEDLYHLIKKAVSVRKHLDRNRKDRDSKFRLILIESRIHRYLFCIVCAYPLIEVCPGMKCVWKFCIQFLHTRVEVCQKRIASPKLVCCRLARYYKTMRKLPPNFKYESTTASTLVA